MLNTVYGKPRDLFMKIRGFKSRRLPYLYKTPAPDTQSGAGPVVIRGAF